MQGWEAVDTHLGVDGREQCIRQEANAREQNIPREIDAALEQGIQQEADVDVWEWVQDMRQEADARVPNICWGVEDVLEQCVQRRGDVGEPNIRWEVDCMLE